MLPQLLRPGFDDTEVLARDTGLPVLGAVSALRSAADELQLRSEARRVVMASVALIAVGGAMVVLGGAGARFLRTLIA